MLYLSGIRLKVCRAHHHRNELDRLIQSFLYSNPYTLFIDPNVQEGYKIVRVRKSKQPPEDIGVIVGDIAHNLRSALDHLACQFVIGNGCTPTTQTAFPIFSEDPKATEKSLNKWKPMVKGMSPAAIRFIEDCQPYKIRHLPDPHHLSILSALSNWDKHHDIHAIGHYFGRVDLCSTGGLTEYIEQPVPIRLEDQTELCRFKTAQEPFGLKTEVNITADFSLCLDSTNKILAGEPIQCLMERVWTYVANDVVENVPGSFIVR